MLTEGGRKQEIRIRKVSSLSYFVFCLSFPPSLSLDRLLFLSLDITCAPATESTIWGFDTYSHLKFATPVISLKGPETNQTDTCLQGVSTNTLPHVPLRYVALVGAFQRASAPGPL